MDQLPQDLVKHIILPYIEAMEHAEHAEKMKPVFDMINRMENNIWINLPFLRDNSIEFNQNIRHIYNIEDYDYYTSKYIGSFHSYNGLRWQIKTTDEKMRTIYFDC